MRPAPTLLSLLVLSLPAGALAWLPSPRRVPLHGFVFPRIQTVRYSVLTGLDMDRVGATLEWAGDLTGDGVGRIAVGDSSEIHLLDPRTETLEAPLVSLPGTDSCVFWGGVDLDGDGRDDFALGGASPDEIVEVYGGPVDVTEPRWTIQSAEGSELGASITTADLDDDGVVELWIGAPGEDAAYGLTLGESPLIGAYEADTTLQGFDDVGDQLLALGDADGDGWEELAVSAPWKRDPTGDLYGTIYIVEGPLDRYAPLADELAFYGVSITSEEAMAAADVDGDGYQDLFVSEGYGFLGPLGGGTPLDAEVSFVEPFDDLTMGDLDLDGRADLVTLSDTGEVAIFFEPSSGTYDGADTILVAASVYKATNLLVQDLVATPSPEVLVGFSSRSEVWSFVLGF